MAAIRAINGKNGTTYNCQIRLRGYKPVSKTFKRKTDAQNWIQKTESEMRYGRYSDQSEARKKTLSDLIEHFMTETRETRNDKFNTKIHLKFWNDKIGHLLLKDVTTAKIKEIWHDFCNNSICIRTNRPYSARTKNYYIQTLSVLFNYAIKECNWLTINPVSAIKKLKENNQRVRYLTEDELRRFMAAVENSSNRSLKVAVLLSLNTGARKTEILSLTWDDVDMDKGILYFRKTKNGDPRNAFINGQALECLKEHARLRQLHSNYVFPGKSNRWKSGKGETSKSWEDLKAPFNRALKEAGINEFHWHDMRHTAASYLMNSGATYEQIGQILGHKNLSMTLRYSHLFQEKSRELSDKLIKTYENILVAGNSK